MSRPQQLERPAVNPTHVASEAPEVVASPRPKPAAIASLEQLSFEPAVGQVSATGSLSQGRERIVGRGTASDVLDGRVAIERPSSDDGVDVKLVAVDDSVTRNASSAGLAFKLDLNGQPANIGARSAAESWELEFDLGLFVESLDDPTAVQFAAKSGCDKAGVCTESEWLDTSIDLDAEVALVSVPGELLGRLSAAAAADEAPLEDEQGAASTTTAEASLLLAATAGTSGEAGNFSASLLESLSSYQVGMPTGQAELTYPIPLPAAPGHVPDLTLRYSSGLVDGVNREKNSQASRAGLGWVEPTAAITRETKECDAYGSQALCPAHGRHDGFSVNFGGVSSPLIRITSDSQGYGHPDYSSSDVKAWDYVTQVKNDWRIRRVEQPSLANNASKNNGDAWTAWWEITTGDGVLHVFGRERVFNPTKVTSLPATQWKRNSVFTQASNLLFSAVSVPLYFGGEALDNSLCTAGYCRASVEWHLDQVIDTSGNMAIYYYQNELNHFEPPSPNSEPLVLNYDSAINLRAVHWGYAYDKAPPGNLGGSAFRVKVEYHEDRGDVPDFACDENGVGECQSLPTFYSKFGLWKYGLYLQNPSNANQHVLRQSWHLTHSDTEDTNGKLWLEKIRHYEGDGSGGELATSPPVTFDKVYLDNRVEAVAGDNIPMPRIETMTTEAGATITFDYDQTHPAGSSGCSTNTGTTVIVRQPCDMYQVLGSGPNPAPVWWHKYKVTKITVNPQQGGSQDMVTNYSYSSPDWAWLASSSGGGYWNDFRGHSEVIVETPVVDQSGNEDGNTGVHERHYFYTGMWDDRTSVGNDNPLGTTESFSPAKVRDAFGDWHPNRLATASASLGVHQSTKLGTSNLKTQHQTVHRYGQATVHTQTVGNPKYENSYQITDIDNYEQVFNGLSSWTVRLRAHEFFDEYGRMTREVDYGQTLPNPDGSDNEYEADNRTTDVSYDPLPGSPGAPAQDGDIWAIANPASTKVLQGVPGNFGATIDLVEFGYDSRGRLEHTDTQSEAGDTSLERVENVYYSNGQIHRIKRYGDSGAGDDQTVTFVYDTTHRWLKQRISDLGSKDKWKYEVDPAYGVQTKVTDPGGRVTEMTYDGLGRLETVKLPDSYQGMNSYEFTYALDATFLEGGDGVDWVKSRQLVNPYAEDDSGKYAETWQFQDALGRTIQTQSRHQGNDNTRAVVSTRYDNRGRALQTTRPVYRPGSPGEYYDEDWANLDVAHSVMDYPITVNAPEGCSSGQNQRTSHRHWDTDTNQILEWATSLTTVCGLETRTWNRDGQLSSNLIDARGNIISSTDTAGATSEYNYNLRDQLIEVEDPAGNLTSYAYDKWQRHGPTEITDPDRGTRAFTYDGHGRLETTTDARGVELIYSYDKIDRPTKLRYRKPNNQLRNVSLWTYDLEVSEYGHLSREIHYNLRAGQGTSAGYVRVDYDYDERARVESTRHIITAMPGGPKTIEYEYFEHNQPETITYPGNVTVQYGYDRQGRPSWMGLEDPTNGPAPDTRTVVLATEYNADNQLGFLKRGYEGTARTLNSYYSYNDRDGSLDLSYTDTGGGTPLTQLFRYDYSDQGKVWSIFEETAADSVKSCFWYDDANRVTRGWSLGDSDNCNNVGTDGAGFEPFNVEYDYDSLGRITDAIGTGTVGGSYTYNGGPTHAPDVAGGNAYSYDAAGNRLTANTSDGLTSYTYDVQGRLIGASNAVSAAMLYTSSGDRAKRVVNGDADYYIAAGLEVNSSGQSTISLRFAGRQVGTYTPDKQIWAQNTDHLGTPTFTVSGPYGTEHYRRYTPFGAPRSASSTGAPSDVTFTAQRDDGALDLMYYGARYYDPGLGQFSQPDRLTADGSNRYAYVRNNPLSFVDSSGLCAHQVFDQCVDVQTGKPTALGTNRFGWKSQYNEVRRAVTQFTDQAFNDLISSAEDLYDLATTNPADVADAAKACARAGAQGCASVVVESAGEALKEAVEPCTGAAASVGRCAGRVATSAYGFKLGSTVSSWFKGLGAPRIPAGLAGSQRTAFSNADSIYRSSELGAIRNAHASGVATEVRIGGTTVLYEPGMPASGMTLFGEDAFVLGPHAFVSEAELAQTLLHESHRLATSARSGSALVTSETQSAFDFAAQNYHALLGG